MAGDRPPRLARCHIGGRVGGGFLLTEGASHWVAGKALMAAIVESTTPLQ
jgi:hypothetical protein